MMPEQSGLEGDEVMSGPAEPWRRFEAKVDPEGRHPDDQPTDRSTQSHKLPYPHRVLTSP
jgi:hypothetical protein